MRLHRGYYFYVYGNTSTSCTDMTLKRSLLLNIHDFNSTWTSALSWLTKDINRTPSIIRTNFTTTQFNGKCRIRRNSRIKRQRLGNLYRACDQTKSSTSVSQLSTTRRTGNNNALHLLSYILATNQYDNCLSFCFRFNFHPITVFGFRPLLWAVSCERELCLCDAVKQ